MIPESLGEVNRRLKDAIHRQGLDKYASDIAAVANPCIDLLTAPDDMSVDRTSIVKQHNPAFAGDARLALLEWRKLVVQETPLGTSRVGGRPDLPASISWPVNRLGAKLHLAAQLDCSKLPQLPGLSVPDTGWLYFFAENTDREFPLPCSVFHYGGSVETLARAPETCDAELAPDYGRPKPNAMFVITQGLTTFSLPEYECEGYDQLPDWSDDEETEDAYANICDSAIKEPRVAQLFGAGGFEGMTASELVREYGKRSGNDWRLLLQVFPYQGFMGHIRWLGDHSLQFYIRKSDLERGDFSNCYATVPG